MISAAQHQLECEARYYLRTMTKGQRTAQYEHIRRARGDVALRALIAEVNRQYGEGRK